MSGHTPGPWVFMDDWAEVVRAEGADTICEVHENPGGDPRADGRLIAAAPALLEALREAEDLVGFHEGCEEVPRPGMHPQVLINAEDYRKILGALRAGIAAATGEEVGA